ncbi:hypothetical protein E2562_020870, partial [Oryza meyeriana var. granulata]
WRSVAWGNGFESPARVGIHELKKILDYGFDRLGTTSEPSDEYGSCGWRHQMRTRRLGVVADVPNEVHDLGAAVGSEMTRRA